MEPIPYSHLERGTLLVASPDIEGFYARSVILLCDHSQSGSFGLTINKPIEIELPEDLLKPGEFEHPGLSMCMGGPIQPNQLMLLHGFSEAPEQTLKVAEGIFLGGDLPFLQTLLEKKSEVPLRLCFGYTGWGMGQLEREFMNGGWFLHPATPELVFNTAPDTMWQSCLMAMGGKYASLAMLPEDLSVN